MLFSRENQGCLQACGHLNAISSAIEQLQRRMTHLRSSECRRSAAPQKNHGMVRGTVVSYGTYTSAAIA